MSKSPEHWGGKMLALSLVALGVAGLIRTVLHINGSRPPEQGSGGWREFTNSDILIPPIYSIAATQQQEPAEMLAGEVDAMLDETDSCVERSGAARYFNSQYPPDNMNGHDIEQIAPPSSLN